jgi:hypothetical protein
MTSQIVLINQSGLAVVSDTMTSYSSSRGGHRTYPTATKIHQLGLQHQVVVLHSGAASIAGVSYELLIGEWALQLTNPLPAVGDYPRMFSEWLTSFKKIEIDESSVAYEALCQDFGAFAESLEDDVKVLMSNETLTAEGESILSAKYREYADRYFKDDTPFLDVSEDQAMRFVRGLPTDVIEHALEHLGFAIQKEKVEWDVSTGLSEAIRYFCVQRFRHWCYSPNFAVLAFAGFGTEEPLGGVVKLEIDGFYLGKLRTITTEREPAANSAGPGIITLAQDGAMADFIRGMSGPRQRELQRKVSRLAHKHFGEIVNHDALTEFSDDLDGRLDHDAWNDFTLPFRRTLNALSLPSLLQLAESLIRIQALRSATAEDEPTVGGRIESLTLNRRQGIQWHFKINENGLGNNNPVHPLI